MDSQTIPAPDSKDAKRKAVEVVSDAQYPEACREMTIARSERETVREMPAIQPRRCTPPPRGVMLTRYVMLLGTIERTR